MFQTRIDCSVCVMIVSLKQFICTTCCSGLWVANWLWRTGTSLIIEMVTVVCGFSHQLLSVHLNEVRGEN